MNLSCSDIIQVLGISASLLTSIIAIVISVLTLKQNSKMLEESLRPNIQIYPLYINTIMYIIIKNYGSSEAHIEKIKCSHKFTSEETLGDNLGTDIFDSLEGALFSPGYSIKCPLIGCAVADEMFKFDVTYRSKVKTYSDTFSFNPVTNAPFADLYPSSSNTDQTLKNIAKELHDIVKTSL